MIWIDYAILGLIALSSVIGLTRGFVREAFSLISWALAVWVGLNFSRDLSGFLESTLSNPSARIAAAFVILFLITLILSSIVSFLIRQLVERTGLTGSDRFIGFVFGIGRGVLVSALLILLAGLTPLPEDSWWKESTLIPPLQSVAAWLRDHLSTGMAAYVSFPP